MPINFSKLEKRYLSVDVDITTNCITRSFNLVPKVKKIIKNKRTTIVLWEDGTKTMVRRAEGTEDDEYFAFASALAKKVYGNNSRIHKLLKEKTVWQESRKNTKIK